MKTLIKLALGFILGFWMASVSREEFLWNMGRVFDWIGDRLYSLFS